MNTRSRMVSVLAAFSAAAALALTGTSPVAAEEGDGGGGGHEVAEVTEVTAGQLVISEFRVRGPNGANDEFIEITNVTATDHTVNGHSGTGYGVAASARSSSPTWAAEQMSPGSAWCSTTRPSRRSAGR